jgi:hypothetical protein
MLNVLQVTAEEQKAGKSSEERGLLFVSYQSDLNSGFVRQTVGYVHNDFFPTVSLIPRPHGMCDFDI